MSRTASMMPCLGALAALALVACGGEPEPRPARQTLPAAPTQPPAADATEGLEDAPEETAATEPPSEDAPDFDAPLPEAPCPPVRIALAHRSAEVPAWLEHAAALRSEDGRFVRVALADHPLERDDVGRWVPPTEGHARFELEAVRRRRGPLEPGPLRAPDSRRGALTHVRVVTSGPLLTFGHREIGRVELTHVDAERVCGVIELDDGFGRVRGAFTAPVVATVER